MAACHPLGPWIGLGPEATGPWPLAASRLVSLRHRGHRLGLGPGSCGPLALLSPCRPVARHRAGATRGGRARCRRRLAPRGPLRAWAAQQRPQLLKTQLRLLHGPHQPKIPPHHLDEDLTVHATRGLDRQPRHHRLAFCGTPRHVVCGLLHSRVLARRPVRAAAGAERPGPTAAYAWLGAQAPAAAGQAVPTRQAPPGVAL
jgi:hypothetical protein